MMDNLRTAANSVVLKIIFGIIIVSFILTGVSGYLIGGGKNYAAKVNGQEISRGQFENAFNSERNRMQQQLGDQFSELAANEGYMKNLRQQTLNRPVGRVTFANGEHMEFTDPRDYLRTIREELSMKDVTGFRFETLTDDPAVRKAVDDMVYDLYGEENPRPLEDYVSRQGPEMGGQQM